MAYKNKTADYQAPDAEVAQENKPVKGKRGSKSASLELNCKASPEVMSEIITDSLHWFNRPIVKSDAECLERLIEFFEFYAKSGGIPTVEKMCLCLGASKQTVWEWQNGAKTHERAEMIKNAKGILASIDADLAIRGLINPVVYIFRGKNYYGMKDQQEVSVTHTARIEDGMSQDEIRRRLLEDSSTPVTELSTATDTPTIETTGEVVD